MILDNFTLAFCGLITVSLLFFFLLSYALTHQGARGSWFWTFAIGSTALGFGLISAQKSFSPWLSIFAANIFLLLGRIGINLSLRVLLNKCLPLYSSAIFLTSFSILFYLFTFVWDSTQIRIILYSFSCILLTIDALLITPSIKLSPESNSIILFLKTLLLCAGLMNVYRLVRTLFYSPAHLLDPSMMTSVMLIVSYLLLMGIVFGVIVFYNAQLRENLRKKNATLEDEARGKDKFLAMIAHDLRTPIGNMASILEILSEESNYATPNGQKIIRLLTQSSKMTFNLLENLLEWARSQRGEIVFEKKEVNVSKTLDSLFEIHSPQAYSKKIELAKTVENDFVVFLDEHAIRTVLYNLISNALKFTPCGGKVSVEISRLNNQVLMSVRDTGIGMDTNYLENVFSYNKNSSREGTAGEKGTGLGLIICKEFVEKNGGRIQICSQPLQGTEVQLYF